MTFVGLDRCQGRWAAVVIDDCGLVGADLVETAAEVGERWPHARVGVDIPLGLPTDRLGRACDDAARAYLGRQAVSVFPALPAELYRLPYDRARMESRRRFGAAPSKQAWNLGTAVLEVAEVADDRWREVHPEVAFRRRAGSQLPPKTRWAGIIERRRLLADHGVILPDDLGTLGERARPDDVLDAAACALVARDAAAGTAIHLPDDADPATEPVIWG